MLYLLKLDNAYKIGYSKNVSNRVKTLQVTHLDVELIATRAGGKGEEAMLHKVCEKYHLKNEMFKIDNEVVSLFTTYVYDHLETEVAKLQKKIEKLENKNKELTALLYNREVLVEATPLSKTTREISFKGSKVRYDVTYYADTLKIGELLYYNLATKEFVDTYGRIAKKYTTRNGQEMYYILSGLALKVEQLNEIINENATEL